MTLLKLPLAFGIALGVALSLSVLTPARASAAQTDASFSSSGALVWTHDTGGAGTTFRLHAQTDGTVAAEPIDGIVLAVRGKLFRWSAREVPVPTGLDCAAVGFGGHPEPGSATRVSLASLSSSAAAISVSKPDYAEALEANMYDQSVALDASLGPYLFVHTSLFSYSCGAHGGQTHDFFVLDAETGRRVTSLYDAAGQAQLDRDLGTQALRTLQADQTLFGTSVTLTESYPVFGDAGLTMNHQWTGTTCYACSDGEWDSYTVSTHIATSELPPALQAYEQAASDAVRALHRIHPELSVGGVSFPSLPTR